MLKVACHCGAVRFRLAENPTWVLDCNCTICRRYGPMWAYYHGADQAKLLDQPDLNATETYIWGDQELAFHRCRICGCMTHMATIDHDPPITFGINMRMAVPALDPAKTLLRQIDNGHTGLFWTRSDAPMLISKQPVEPPPGPDDWR